MTLLDRLIDAMRADRGRTAQGLFLVIVFVWLLWVAGTGL